MAIVNVSAFIFVLLNQISEQISYKNTKILIKNQTSINIKDLETAKDINTNVIDELQQFYEITQKSSNIIKTEVQLIGSIKAYLETKFPDFQIFSEYSGNTFSIYRPDLVIMSNKKIRSIIEVKKEYHKSRLDSGFKQVKSYLYESKLKEGILFFYTDRVNYTYKIESKIIDDIEIKVMIPYKQRSN